MKVTSTTRSALVAVSALITACMTGPTGADPGSEDGETVNVGSSTSTTLVTGAATGNRDASSADVSGTGDSGSETSEGLVEPDPACPSFLLDPAVIDVDSHFAVGLCNSDEDCGVEQSNCSATLIAPNLVLTARHCVDRGIQPAQNFCDASFLDIVDPDTIFVTTHPDPYNTDEPGWVGASEILLPPDGDTVCDFDIALVVLERSMTPEEAEPATVDLNRSLVQEAPQCGFAIAGRGARAVELVGVGENTYYAEIVDDGDLRRRLAVGLPLLCASDDDDACLIEDITDPSGTFVSTPTQVIIGPAVLPGDSGSGVLDQERLSRGEAVVVAVAHAGTYGVDEEPNSTLGIRVEVHAQFLRDGVATAAEAGSYPLPDWAR